MCVFLVFNVVNTIRIQKSLCIYLLNSILLLVTFVSHTLVFSIDVRITESSNV